MQTRELIGIAAIGLDAVARLARHLRGRDHHAQRAVAANEPAQRKTARPGLVTELQRHAWMRGRKFFDQAQQVIVLSADDPVTAHFNRIGGRQRHGDGVVMHIQADEHGRIG